MGGKASNIESPQQLGTRGEVRALPGHRHYVVLVKSGMTSAELKVEEQGCSERTAGV